MDKQEIRKRNKKLKQIIGDIDVFYEVKDIPGEVNKIACLSVYFNKLSDDSPLMITEKIYKGETGEEEDKLFDFLVERLQTDIEYITKEIFWEGLKRSLKK